MAVRKLENILKSRYVWMTSLELFSCFCWPRTSFVNDDKDYIIDHTYLVPELFEVLFITYEQAKRSKFSFRFVAMDVQACALGSSDCKLIGVLFCGLDLFTYLTSGSHLQYVLNMGD